MTLREFSIDDIESLAVGAWVLGTGGDRQRFDVIEREFPQRHANTLLKSMS